MSVSRAVLDDSSKTEVRFAQASHSIRLVGTCLVLRNEFKNAVLADEGVSAREGIVGTSLGAVLLDVSFELELVARFTQLGTSRLWILEVLDSPFILTWRATGSGWVSS